MQRVITVGHRVDNHEGGGEVGRRNVAPKTKSSSSGSGNTDGRSRKLRHNNRGKEGGTGLLKLSDEMGKGLLGDLLP